MDELSSVTQAARIPLKHIATELTALELGFQSAARLLKKLTLAGAVPLPKEPQAAFIGG